MALALVQWKSGFGITSLAFDNPAAAGNALFAMYGRNDNSLTANISSAGWADINTGLRAHTTFGGTGTLAWKAAAGGETTVAFTVGGGQSGKIVIAEFSGVNAAGGLIGAAAASAIQQNSSTVSLASGTPSVPALVIGGCVNRLNDPPPGGSSTLVAGASDSRIPVPTALYNGSPTGNNLPVLLWTESTVGAAETLSATMGGNSQDGYWWGMQIVAVATGSSGSGTRSQSILAG